jgi:hypothetical protein
LAHIVHVGWRGRGGQGKTLGVGQHMVFDALLPAIRGVGAGVRPPKTARAEPLSTSARDQSITPAPFRCPSRTCCTAFHTPARCQSRSRRQQVIPEPQPSSCGKSTHAIPVRKTNKMPVSALRFATGGRPPRGYVRGGGSNGSINAHKPSGRIGRAMTAVFLTSRPPCARQHTTPSETHKEQF